MLYGISITNLLRSPITAIVYQIVSVLKSRKRCQVVR